MSEQSSTQSRETFHATHQWEQTSQQQTLPQPSQQLRMRLPCRQNVSSFPELLSQGFSIANSSREIIERVLTEGVYELLVPSSSSLSSSIQQPNLQMNQQRVQTSQQRYPEGNQFILQVPVQTNQQQPSRMSQQSHAEQLLLQVPLQQSQQMLHVVNPGNTNTQMFLQVPQLQANSNIPSRESSSIASQQSHMQRAESLFPQASQQSMQTVQQQNPQGLSQYANQELQSQQALDGSQQQHIQRTQQLLLQLSQQIPILALQQSLQQTQPLLVQVLQQSSTTSQQLRPQQNQYPFLQIPQQPRSNQRMPIRSSLQQVRSTPQAPTQSSQRPLVQQSNQVMPSVLRQMQSNQSSTSSEQSVSQRIQQILQQISQQLITESRGTDSENVPLLARLTQMTQQQSNQQQIVQQPQVHAIQEPFFTHVIPCGSLGVPLGILQVSESQLQPCQQSSQSGQDSLEIPEVSLFDLSPQQFMRIIQQCPYNRPSNQESSMHSARQSLLKSRQKSSLSSRQVLSTSLRQGSSTQLAQESLLQSDQESSASLHRESSAQLPQQCSLLSENQSQELSPETITSSNQISPSSILNDTFTSPITNTTNANELQETFAEENQDDEESNNDDEESDHFISGAETNTLSTRSEMLAAEHINMRQLQAALSRTSETIAFTTPGNSSESQEAIADNGSDSTIGTTEHTTGTIGYMDSRHISNLNDNNTISFNNDYLTPLILTPIAALTSSLNNQQTQSDIPDNSTIISLLLNHVLNPNEINLLLMGNNNNNNNNTNDDEAMESRNDLYQMLGGDQHTLQEMRNRIADIHAKIESLSYLINRAMMMTNDSL